MAKTRKKAKYSSYKYSSPVKIKSHHGKSPTPKASIIILAFNGLSYTRLCLESIKRYTSKVNYELVLIDNGSTDGTVEYLKTLIHVFDDITIIFNRKNQGFSRGVNQGIKHSRGHYIVLLNNDTIVSEGWLEKLISIANRDNKFGIVSPVTNYVGEGPQLDEEAACITVGQINSYARKIAVARRGQFIEVPDRLVFFCVLIKPEVINNIGFFDEQYTLGNFEDDDFCLRTRLAGFKLIVAQEVFIFHFGSKTFEENRIDHTRTMEQNRQYFYNKLAQLATFPSVVDGYRTYPSQVKVSVLIRTFNRPTLLRECLKSLANQIFKDFEVIVVNDGGNDVEKIVSEFQQLIKVNYIRHTTSRGRSAGWNSGLEASSGRYIAYLDDDDIYYPNHLEILVGALENSDYQVAYTDVNKALLGCIHNDDPQVLARVPFGVWQFNRDELLIQNSVPIISLMCARECIEEVGTFDEDFEVYEDWDFLIRLSQRYDFHRVVKTTCEYRFFQGLTNVIVSRRKLMLKFLKKLYNKYLTIDKLIDGKRQKIIIQLESQIARIQWLQDQNKPGEEVNYEIIRLVTGLYPPKLLSTRLKLSARAKSWLNRHPHCKKAAKRLLTYINRIRGRIP